MDSDTVYASAYREAFKQYIMAEYMYYISILEKE